MNAYARSPVARPPDHDVRALGARVGRAQTRRSPRPGRWPTADRGVAPIRRAVRLPGVHVDRDRVNCEGGPAIAATRPAAADHGDGAPRVTPPVLLPAAMTRSREPGRRAWRPVDSCTGPRHERLLDEGADAQGGRARCRLERHRLPRVVGVKQWQVAASAGAALPHTARQLSTTKSPGATCDSGADRFDDAGSPWPSGRELVGDAALAIVQAAWQPQACTATTACPVPGRGR